MAKKIKKIIEGEVLTDEQKFLSLALDRFQKLYDAEFHIREAALEDLKFVYNVDGGQWPDSVRQEREDDGRPCLTFNKLRKYVAQVANHEREQRLACRVRPVDDKGDKETARIIEGIIRQIENASKADEIYATVGEKAVAGGFGFWRLLTKEKEDSFEQEIFIEKIENQFSCYLDPDGNYGFIRQGMSKKEFQHQYPDVESQSFERGIGEEYSRWYEPDKVYIAEYFYKDQYDKTIAQCVSPATGISEVIELNENITPELLAANGIEIVKQKTKKAQRVKWAKITAHKILEEGEWVGRDIPIIEVVGDEVEVAGQKYKRSLVRDGKDPQRMYNYWLTHITESVALIPKSPYIVTPQEIKNFEPMWNDANKKPYPYLLYNPSNGKRPQREAPPQIQSGAAHLLTIADQNISDTIGMYEASFGEKSNERTGIAIQKRASASAFGIYHFHDNFARAIRNTTRQLIDIIPKIYDTERVERILGEDDKEETVTINKAIIHPVTGERVLLNDLSVGKFDTVADVRMYATRRQEAAQMMAETMQGAPNIAPLILDLVFKYNDFPGAEEIQKRLEKHMDTLLGKKDGNQPDVPGQNNTPNQLGGM